MHVAKLSTIAQSFSPLLARDGPQVCCPDPTRATNLSPSCEFQCDQNARRKLNSTARFLKENKFSFYFQNTSFFGLGKKNQLNSGHTENHTRLTNLSPSSDQGDKLVGLVTSGYV
jgi:hypothetical protein